MRPKSWITEFSGAFKNLAQLYEYLNWPLEDELLSVAACYPLFIPQGLAQRIKSQGPDGILAKEFLPDLREMDSQGLADPIGDRTYQKEAQLIHRYPSRVLFTPTSVCPVHCRYCFRKNELSASDELFAQNFSATLEYLKTHSEISELIFTGGDPFTLSTEKLDFYLSSFAKITHIKDIRFHTRYPVILPGRFDEDLKNLIHKWANTFRTITIAIHANHTDEFSRQAEETILELSKLPVQLLSQTVLLKGVNDSTEIMMSLMEKFLSLKVRPYYLHHPDRVKGGMHFYLTLEEGRKIYAPLRKFLPGWAIPQYVIDVPGGFGKVSAYNPENLQYSGKLLSQDMNLILIEEKLL